jgi:hypothetical protein
VLDRIARKFTREEEQVVSTRAVNLPVVEHTADEATDRGRAEITTWEATPSRVPSADCLSVESHGAALLFELRSGVSRVPASD